MPFFHGNNYQGRQQLATFTWQDDQALDPASDVDYFVRMTTMFHCREGKGPMHPAHSLDSGTDKL